MSRSSRTCRRAAEVRWTVETHPTLIYCRSRQTVLGSLVANTGGGYDLTAPDAADAVVHINDLLRVDGGIVTPIYYWTCINESIAPSHAVAIDKLLDAGADPEKRSTYRGRVDTLLLGLVRQHSAWTRYRSNLPVILPLLSRVAINAVSTTELKTRFGVLPHRQTALGLATFDQGLMRDDRVLSAQRDLILWLRRFGARLTDGDFFCLCRARRPREGAFNAVEATRCRGRVDGVTARNHTGVDRARRWDRKFLDKQNVFGGAALTLHNGWSFPPCYFRTARLLAAEVRLRDGILGRGLGHEIKLLQNIILYLGRADIVGFFPERLDTVLYSAKESKKYRNRGRRDKYCS